MITVYFYGRLRHKFGKSHRFNVETPTEAVRLLEANFPGQAYTTFNEGAYYIKRGPSRKNSHFIPGDAVTAGLGGEDLHIMPALHGASNKGIIEAVLGVVLIGAALALAPFSAGTSLLGIGAALGTASGIGISYGTIAAVGGALLLGGLANLLTPGVPAQPATNNSAFEFGGPINTTNQGSCVPVVYGRCLVGSTVISAGIHVDSVGAFSYSGSYLPRQGFKAFS